ncbi:MAG: heme-copper oxidase subunit III [Sphingobacteriia bacterium]|nr:heme-copper oxidase subunit III [Sphingobacteriia bacterium]
MTAAASNQRNRIHPHKFTLWVAMASICMMFAGLTSAYIVKKNQSNWLEFDLPVVFYYSTIVILISSLTMHLAVKAIKARERSRYKNFMLFTAALGVVFGYLQWTGFANLKNHGIQLLGNGSNPAASFLVVIIGLHVLHVLGGIIALLITTIRAFRTGTKVYTSTPVEIVATYWHFVDLLWIYLFIFLNWIK